ncbi:MAG: molybdopterin-guanine dinucleotide biosynthesis protein B [Candidatus Cloacimonadota bacterium]|nr:molybdopterin-guanine dinucleotide biosynthesis protein B [Candidatus Cloacimonadota bacterium]
MKVFSVSGYHHTGKTRLVVELIKELKKRGHRVVSIKDIHFEDFAMETEGTNSYQHWEASNDVVFARGINETYQIWHRQLSLNEMLEHLNADYVVIEGMKKVAVPRILCAKDHEQIDELLDETIFAISGKFADKHFTYKNLKVYNSREDIQEIADMVEKKVFEVLPLPVPECCGECGFSCYEMVGKILKGEKTRKDCVMDNDKKIELRINGKEMKIVPFVQRMFRDVIIGMVKNLKGYEKGQIELKVDMTD